MSNFDFDVRISNELLDQLHDGVLTPSMLLTMTVLYRWSDWNTGIVKNVSAGGLHTWSRKAFSERTFSEALRKLEWMGWITRHMKVGSHKSYRVTIHNYKITDDAGKVQVINPKTITVYEEFPSGRCEEGSDETSWEASDETSDRTNLKPNLEIKSEDKSEDQENKKERKKASSASPQTTVSLPEPTNSSDLGSVASQGQHQRQKQDQPLRLTQSVIKVMELWQKRTKLVFTQEEADACQQLIWAYGRRVVYAVLYNALYQREKTAKWNWNNFMVFANNWKTNHELYLAWCEQINSNKKLADRYGYQTPVERWQLRNATKEEQTLFRDYYHKLEEDGKSFPIRQWQKDNGYETERGGHVISAVVISCLEDDRAVTWEEFQAMVREADDYIISEQISPQQAATDLMPVGRGLDMDAE